MKILTKISMYLFLLIVSFMILLPFVWMTVTAFKTQIETMLVPFTLLPNNLYLGNFAELFTRGNFGVFYMNTIFVSFWIIFPQLFISSLAAYAFARLEFPFKNVIFVSMLIALMVPTQMFVFPRYMLMMSFNWINSLLAIIIPGIPSIFTTFFIRQFFQTIPKELDESAYIDGCSHIKIYLHILLPMSKPALISMGLLSLTFAWNDLFWPLIVISSPSRFVLSIGIANFTGQWQTPMNLVMAAALVSMLPLIILYFFLQKYFITGIATGGVKE